MLGLEGSGEIHRIMQPSFSPINLTGGNLLGDIINNQQVVETINIPSMFYPEPHFEIVYCHVCKGYTSPSSTSVWKISALGCSSCLLWLYLTNYFIKLKKNATQI